MNIKAILIFLFLIIILLFNCNRLRPTLQLAEQLIIQSLEAKNISENLTPVATQNDEIFFMINAIQKKENKFELKQEIIITDLLFDSLNHEYFWEDQLFKLQSNIDYIVFSLVELDDYGSSQKVERILKEKIRNGYFLGKIEKAEMDSILSYDDFLGMQYLKRENIFKERTKNIKISGMQMFDKYDYRISVTGN